MKIFTNNNGFFLKPLNQALKVVLDPENATCGDSLVARVSLLAQVLFSLTALLVLLSIGLITAGANLCTGSNAKAFTPIKDHLKYHVLLALPLSIIGILAPLHITKDLRNSLNKCLN